MTPDRDRRSPDEETAAATVAGGGRDDGVTAGDAVELEQAPPRAERAADASGTAAWLFRQGEAPREVELGEVPDLIRHDENVLWVDLVGYAEADLSGLAELIELEPAFVRAALTPWERPRLDVAGSQVHVRATVAQLAGDDDRLRVQAAQLDLFVRANALASAHLRPLPFAERIFARARQSPDLPALDAGYLLYLVLDELVQHTERLAEEQEDAIEAMEERALQDLSDAFLGDLLHLKRAVFALGRLTDQHREVFAAFLRPEFRLVAETGMEPYFRDLEARLAHLLERLAAAKESVDGAFDIYVSHVAHRTNDLMRLLTVVSTVLLPATVILGLFGTDFQGVPLYTKTAFWAMLALIAVVTVAIALAFRRRGWLGDRSRGIR